VGANSGVGSSNKKAYFLFLISGLALGTKSKVKNKLYYKATFY